MLIYGFKKQTEGVNMKCPYCGAEASGNRCDHCGSELPERNVKSESKGTAVVCPNCGSNNLKFKRERIASYGRSGNYHGKRYSSGASRRNYEYHTIALCQNCGATWEMNYGNSGHGCLWWTIVILFLPISLPILFITTNKIKLNKWIRVAIVIAVYALILLTPTDNKSKTSSQPGTESVQNTSVNPTAAGTVSVGGETIEKNTPKAEDVLPVNQTINDLLAETPVPALLFTPDSNMNLETTEISTGAETSIIDKSGNEITETLAETSIVVDQNNGIINNPNDVGTMLRVNPSIESDVLLTLKNGSPVKIIEQERKVNGYILTKIQTESGLTGWVMSDHVERNLIETNNLETDLTEKEDKESSVQLDLDTSKENLYADLDSFILNFNAAGSMQITSLEKIDIHDESAGHYRVEFRLGHFDNAVAYHVEFNDGSSADLIDTAPNAIVKTSNGSIDRIYVLANSIDSFEKIFRISCLVMHPDKITESDIDEVIYKMMHPYRYEEMEYLNSSGSGVIARESYSYTIREKTSVFEFFLD